MGTPTWPIFCGMSSLRNVFTAQQFRAQFNMLSRHVVILALHAAREAGKSPLMNDLASITVFLNFL